MLPLETLTKVFPLPDPPVGTSVVPPPLLDPLTTTVFGYMICF